MPETPKTPPPDHLDIWLVEQNARPMWAFAWGTAPTETARAPDVADPSTFFMEQLGATP